MNRQNWTEIIKGNQTEILEMERKYVKWKIQRRVSTDVRRQKQNQQSWTQDIWNYTVQEWKKKKNEWTKEGLRDQKDVFKINNICIKGIPEERGRKNIYRNNGQKVPNLMKDMNLCVQEVQWTSSRLNSKKPT